ncbi:MAG: hypothetical protein L6V92_00490 [Phocaeicola vulgatus]|nr:MAG: hypothetical protein L6V92_00490 [Phocaeicola vulgatus]
MDLSRRKPALLPYNIDGKYPAFSHRSFPSSTSRRKSREALLLEHPQSDIYFFWWIKGFVSR